MAVDNPAVKFVSHMLLGALTARPLIEDRPADTEFLTRYLEVVVFPALQLC